MQLPSISQRNNIGIDTFERAIIYAASLLRNGLLTSAPELARNIIIYQDSASFTVNNPLSSSGSGSDVSNQSPTITTKEKTLVCEIKLPYEQTIFLPSTGNFIESILELSQEIPQYIGNTLPPSNVSYSLPVEPSFVNTLEKYLVWASSQWISLMQSEFVNAQELAYFSNLEAAQPAVYSAKCVLKFDFNNYPNTLNWLS
jgi:hypothetical protein